MSKMRFKSCWPIESLSFGRWTGMVSALGLVLWGVNAQGQASVNTLGGGSVAPPYAGYVDGNTLTASKFAMPTGMAVDPTGTTLFIADYTNNAVRMVSQLGNTSSSMTTTFAKASNSGTTPLNHPIAVVLDTATNLYVLNHGTGNNGAVLHFGGVNYGAAVVYPPLALNLVNATAMTIDGYNNLYVTVNGNKVIRVTPSGVVTTVGTVTQTGTSLQGIAMYDNGTLALTDAGNNGIWLMNPVNGAVSKLTGFHGVGDVLGGSGVAAFNSPETIAKAGNGIMVVADYGNHKVKLVDASGTVSLLYGVSSSLWISGPGQFPGWRDGVAGTVAGDAESRLPYGVTVAQDGRVFVTETYYHVLRQVTGTGLAAPSPSFVPVLNSPSGIALDSAGGSLFIADFTNNVVQLLNLANNQTTLFLTPTNGISHPASVFVDTNNYLYVLNQNAGTNGNILQFDSFGNFLGTNVTGLNQPTALTMDANGNIFITEQTGSIKILFPWGATNTIATISTNVVTLKTNVSLQGIAIFDDGTLAVSDAGNHVVWNVNPLTKLVTKLAGQVGTNGNTLGASNFAKLNHPLQLARAANNQLLISDSGNNRLVLASRTGAITNVLVSSNSAVWYGRPTDPFSGTTQPMVLPAGVTISASGVVFDSEPTNALIRRLTTSLPAPASPPIVTLPYFNLPEGIAYDSTANFLFIADYGNNAVEQLDLTANTTSTFLDFFNGVMNPVSVLVDANENVYVLNQGSSPGNGYIEEYDVYGNDWGSVATGLNQPTAFLLDGYGAFYVTEQSGNIRVFSPTRSETVVTIATNANVSLQGIALFDDGYIAASDAGNHVIWLVNPISKLVSRLTGQIGTNGTAVGTNRFAQLNQPHQLLRVAGNQIVAADYGNNRLVLVQRNGTTLTNSTSYHPNSSQANIWFGSSGDPVASGSPRFVKMVQPFGLAMGSSTLFASETFYSDIRGLNATGISAPSFNPGVPLPPYSYPAGIALNYEATVLYVTDPTNNSVSAIDLVANQTSLFLSTNNGVSRPVDVASDNNDNVYILNQGTSGDGSIMEFDQFGNFVTNIVTGLTMPTAMKLTFTGTFFVTEQNGLVQMFNSTGSNTVANINTNANVQLQGVTVLDNGIVVVSDAGNHVLWQIPAGATNANATLFTGVIGSSGTNFGSVGSAKLNRPMRLAQANGGQLLIADSGNNRIVVADDSGKISRALTSTNANIWFSLPIDPVTPTSPNFVPMLSPVGLVIGGANLTNQVVYDSETVYKDIRGIFNTGITAPIAPPPTPLNLVATPALGQITLTWSASSRATNYYVYGAQSSHPVSYTRLGTTSDTSFIDTNVLAGATYYYVVVAVNSGGLSAQSAEASATAPFPPITAPQIGYVDFPKDPVSQEYLSVFHAISSLVLNNDAPIIIDAQANSQTYYIYSDSSYTNLPDPNTNCPSAAVGYTDLLPPDQVDQYTINARIRPFADVTIKAYSTRNDGSPSSAIVKARIQHIVANPTITGQNSAQFTVSDITTNVNLYYTLDGSDPSGTNGIHLTASSSNIWTIGFPIFTNTQFKVIAIRDYYQPSAIVSTVFSASNFVANTISFGFTSGEASSDFVASPGQTFYAPVTLTTLPGSPIYSLQFNVVATNAGINPGPAIAPGSFGFHTSLVKPVKDGYIQIPPYAYVAEGELGLIPAPDTNSYLYGGNWFENLVTANDSENLLMVGWLERAGLTNLYPTTSQDLIKYSIAHDDLFPNLLAPNGTILGGYSVVIPGNATNGQTYQIQIGRPSATSDGIGAPGSDVYISAPTNGSTAGGAPMNALKYITVGQRKYIAGSVYPFRWFNAGDFGSTNLVNADVEQVFQSAIYAIDYPMPNSDFFDAMDSSGNLGVVDSDPASVNYGYFTNAGPYVSYQATNVFTLTNYTVYYDTNFNPVATVPYPYTVTNIAMANTTVIYFNGFIYYTNIFVLSATNSFQYVSQYPQTIPFYTQLNVLLGGNDTTINQVAFGDGQLDVCDVYVTFRRSLDPGLTWYRRFWNGGQRVADTNAPNVAAHALVKSASVQSQSQPLPAGTASMTPLIAPQVNFSASDIQGSAGQTVQIPINATVLGNYPLRVLMLNLSIEPLDGAPDLTSAIQFTQTAAALGAPLTTTSSGNDNFAAVWLNSTNTGLTGTTTIGTLSVTIPATAGASAAYAVHFDHASASPNGLGSFAKQTLTGLLTLSSRTNSSFNDGIPDTWRLRWFGSVNNMLSASNACPSGDGVPNWKKYLAGVDPNVAGDFPSVNPRTPAPYGVNSAIHWPSVQGTHYVIERARNLFTGPWTILSTNTGTGGDMEFDDTNNVSPKFYRVLITP